MNAPTPPVPPAFTGVRLDRVSLRRKDPEWVRAQLADPAARAVVAARDTVLVDRAGTALARVAVSEPVRELGLLLGLDGDVPVFALDLEDERTRAGDGDGPPPSPAAEEPRLVPLRDAAEALEPAEAGLAAYLTAMLNWQRRHRFCANCGARTEVEEAGYSRRCPRCGALHFPRTDPVVIMTVEHEDRLLLGRRPGWPFPRYSVLAGFVSPGETAEEAVIREVGEESGILARDPRFVASQPWPFPASLMLGFAAASDGGEPRVGDRELEAVGWFDAETVRAAACGQGTQLALPPRISIARFLIEDWLARRGV